MDITRFFDNASIYRISETDRSNLTKSSYMWLMIGGGVECIAFGTQVCFSEVLKDPED